MHAHQSKAPRATLQHTHTYSTHSTAGTDQFIENIITAHASFNVYQPCYNLVDDLMRANLGWTPEAEALITTIFYLVL